MISRGRTLRLATDHGAPGLILYGLHRVLNSDTDDTDYEPGKDLSLSKRPVVRRKKTRVIDSSEDASTTESSACSTESEEEQKPPKKKAKVPNNKRKKTKLRAFGAEPNDESDSDYIPDDEKPKVISVRQKKQSRKAKKPSKKSTNTKRKAAQKARQTIEEQKYQLIGTLNETDSEKEENTSNSTLSPPKEQNYYTPCSDKWGLLPVEILSKIFHHVTCSDDKGVRYLCRCARVCHHWNDVASKPISWKYIDLSFLAGKIGCKKKKPDRLLTRLARKKLCETKELQLSGWKHLTDNGLEEVGKHCTKLELINIAHCQKNVSKISDSLQTLAVNCSLKKVNFSDLRVALNHKQKMTEFFNTCGVNLVHINVSDNIAFSNALFHHITNKCHKLRYFDFSNTSVSSINFKEFQEKCPHIEELYMTNINIPPQNKVNDNITLSPGFPHLRVLSFATFMNKSWMQEDVFFSLIKTTTHLRVLDVRGWSHLPSITSKEIKSNHLERLFLSSCIIDEVTMNFICSKWASSLWDLDLSKINTNKNFSAIVTVFTEGPHPCTNLRCLNLSTTDANNEHVRKVLSNLKELEILDLTLCRALSRGLKRHYRNKKEIKALFKKLKQDK